MAFAYIYGIYKRFDNKKEKKKKISQPTRDFTRVVNWLCIFVVCECVYIEIKAKIYGT